MELASGLRYQIMDSLILISHKLLSKHVINRTRIDCCYVHSQVSGKTFERIHLSVSRFRRVKFNENANAPQVHIAIDEIIRLVHVACNSTKDAITSIIGQIFIQLCHAV